MKVYSIEGDINNYQIILPVSTTDEIYDMLDFDGLSKKEVWKPLEFYIDNPLKKKSDFLFFINPSAFACTARAVNELGKFWHMCGELLPIYLEDGTPLHIINVLDCVNALDKKNSEFDYYHDGTRSNRILKYSFHTNRFHESSIFKIPENAATMILTYTRYNEPEDEFIAAYNEKHFEGLNFELLFSDD